MYSFGWPNIFTGSTTNLITDKEAAINNLRLILGSEKLGLFGDPKFGSNLKRYLYEQNSTWLHDIIRDEIYTLVRIYMPQLVVQRKDIKIITDKTNLFAEITCRWYNDPRIDMFNIRLTED